MLPEVQQVPVAADNEVGEAFSGGSDIDVVSGIGLDDMAGHPTLYDQGDRAQRINPEIELLVPQPQSFSDFGVSQGTPKLLESRRRDNQLKNTLTKETNENPAGRTFRPN